MFGEKKQSAWYFDSSIHLEAFSRLLYLIEVGEPFGVICGPDGSGRTRILNRLREEAERIGKQVISLNLAGLDEDTALAEFATCVTSSARRNMPRHQLICALRDEMAGRAHCNSHTVLMLDDLHRAQSDMESFLRVLTALNAGGQGKLTVIVASDRPLENGLSLESLLQIRLTALDVAESSDFVRSLVRRHGVPTAAIDETAIRAIHELSRGNTARMARVCELIGILHEASPGVHVSADTVSAVMNELTPRAVA
ncbi:MAG TPA: ATP-binding protein [Planctomycetaceae bacterium]|nr:ATP-binding protein [Planctomycetaceae bacterium]HQZ65433.1 ATP-binding protein [Planctomycetaceae bacterium]HRA88762.1 ATP-binding protein [Planctomycetaceae bacterium]